MAQTKPEIIVQNIVLSLDIKQKIDFDSLLENFPDLEDYNSPPNSSI